MTITPDGFRYRSQIFPTVNGLFRWFKDHYQEPVPGTEARYLLFIVCITAIVSCLSNIFSSIKGITPSNSSRTRTPASLNATPANINIAGGCRPLTRFDTFEWFCPRFHHFLTRFLLPRLDPCCQRAPAQHDLADVQCHRRGHRPGSEPQHHARTVGL